MKFVACFILLLFFSYGESGKYFIQPKTFNLKNEYRRFLEEYEDFKKNEPNFAKNYNNETFLKQRAVQFERILTQIKAHNENYKLGLVDYSRKPMQYSDWSPELKQKRLCGARMRPKPRALSNAQLLRIIKGWPKLPNNTQVNNCQFPNPVRDQQTCGCCWAFSTISVIESILMTKKNIKTELSVQQLVDCDDADEGCDGGWPTTSFRYMQVNGLTSGQQYAYKNMQQQACRKAGHRNVLPPQFIVKQIEVEFKGDEESLRKLLYRTKSPVVIAAHANEAFMSVYTGRYKNETCPKNDPNHAMVMCGFGSDKFGDYWLIRNSWSANWGENGFIKMAANNTCGVASFAMYPVIVGVRELDPFLGEIYEKQFRDDDRRYRD
ncbi:crustapain-like [Chironomus tepperi]|uniref:crustapain-like n=1 Tax=Chironomus tepperi TaxID=113505 RepID=UPI00391F2A1E